MLVSTILVVFNIIKTMGKVTKNIVNSVDSNWLKFASGIFVCLLSVFCALSYTPSNDYFIYVSRFLNWCLSFLVGSYLAFGVYALMFLYGLSLIFSTKKRIKANLSLTIFGTSFIILGALILISNSQTLNILDEEYLTFANFQKIFQKTILEDFPQTDLFSNSGIIGMFLVALINSPMTYIGSNVIGSIFLLLGVFFAFAKPSIKFGRIITDYYRATFGKKQLHNTAGYNVAKDVSYDTNAINAIKINQEVKREEEEKALLEERNKIQEVPVFATTSRIHEEDLFKPKKLNDVNSTGLSKARFDIDGAKNTFSEEEIKEQETISNTEMQNAKFDFGIPEMSNNQPEIKEEPRIQRISDMFTIPPKKSVEEIKDEIQTNAFEEVKFEATPMETKEEELLPPKFDFEETNQPINQNSFEPRIQPNSFNKIPEDTVVNVEPVRQVEEIPHVMTPTERARLDELANKKPEGYFDNEYSNKIEVKTAKPKNYALPSSTLLEVRDESKGREENEEVADARKQKINQIFEDLGVGAQITSYTIGPSVTQYDVQTDRNVSVNGLGKYISDISIRLGGLDARFVQIVQGKSTSGIEIANAKSSLVNFKDCLDDLNNRNCSKLTIPFGKDISGHYVCADLKDFPHLLVCGTTGSGKSIFIHSVIMSLIMRNTPDELKLVMIDPKRVEFGKYKDIAHLMCPPVNDSNKAYVALNKLVDLMEFRYRLFEKVGVSNIKQYNADALENGKDKLPYIVLICDEFADLMDTNRKCSEPVVRIGQKARAAGIHMIIATQRPSVNVITGVIKANLPVRVALSCSSYTDSQTILGEGGAEKLLGNGDMLVMCPLLTKQGFTRVQGSFVDNKEIKHVCDFLRANAEPEYDPVFVDLEDKSKVTNIDSEDQAMKVEKAFDDKYEEVKRWVVNEEYTSISKIQRTFGFGFPRAGKIFARLEEEGIVAKDTDSNNAKGKKVLVHHIEVTEQSENPGSSEQSTFSPNYNSNGMY